MKAEDRAVMAAIPLELERILSELSVGLQSFQNGRPLEGARACPVGGLDGRPLVWGGSGRLVGWSLRSVDGAAATVILRDGRSVDGMVIAAVDLSAEDRSRGQWMGPGGVSFTEGCYAQVTGNVEGAVWIGAVD